MLGALLDSLDKLTAPEPATHVVVAVIDNDPDGGAQSVVEAAREAGFAFELRYAREARPGVSHVRNAALQMSEGADFLAFVDDDETVNPDWLRELLKAQDAFDADAVFGPVEAVYLDDAPAWLRRGDFHSKPTPADGLRYKPGGSCNCLVRLAPVRDRGLAFDPGLSLIGGEDTLFFTQMLEQGCVLADAKDALVYEIAPPDRATARWVLNRWYRTGFTDAQILSRHMAPGRRRLWALTHSLIRLSVGGTVAALYAAAFAWWRPETALAKLYTPARGAGMLAFVFGKPFEEYGRPGATP